jgi:hypothetical protein
MIACYAMGGGMGHLARARRVLRSLGCAGGDAAILSASPLARGPDIVRVPRRLAGSRVEFAAWLKKTLRALAPAAVVVDAFPLGILGELADPRVLPEVPLYHVARLLKWNAYREAFAGSPRKYDAILAVEKLTGSHQDFLGLHSRAFRSIDLPFQNEGAKKNPFEKRPVWLVVHSGSAPEIHALLKYAAEQAKRENARPHYVVVSPRAPELPAGVAYLAHPRASELFPHAERIVTACGFNSMLETGPWRARHLYMPLERRFDDQALRAQRAYKEPRFARG